MSCLDMLRQPRLDACDFYSFHLLTTAVLSYTQATAAGAVLRVYSWKESISPTLPLEGRVRVGRLKMEFLRRNVAMRGMFS
jgi:hypothetical protein